MRRVGRSGRNKAHRVKLCRWARPGGKSGGRLALFAFSYLDLAKLFELEVPTVQKLVKRGRLDVLDLRSIAEEYARRRKIPTDGDAASGDPPPTPSGEFN